MRRPHITTVSRACSPQWRPKVNKQCSKNEIHELLYKKKKNRLRDTENKLMVPKGKGWGNELGVRD